MKVPRVLDVIALVVLLCCACREEGAAITLLVQDLPPEVYTLRVTPALQRDGWRPWGGKTVTQRLERTVLHFAPEVSGQVRIEVVGLGQDRCPLAAGAVEVDLPPLAEIEAVVRVPGLSPEQRGCRLDLALSGDGAVRCSALPAGAADFVEVPCDAPQVHGTPLRLSPEPGSAAYFLGWSGACGGGGVCEVTLSDQLQAARATFHPRAVCLPDLERGRWCWENPLPQGNYLTDISVVSPTEAWAVGSGGTILRWNGSFWAPVPSGLDQPIFLSGVWARAGEVWVVGAFGTVLRWDGAAFVPVPVQANGRRRRNALLGVGGIPAPQGAPAIWAGGQEGLVLRWDGARMQEVDTAALFSPAERGEVVGGSLDDIIALGGIWGRRQDDVWVVGSRDTVLRWDGTRLRRTSVAQGPAMDLVAAWGRRTPSGGDEVFLSGLSLTGTSGVTLHWDGATYSRIPRERGIMELWGQDAPGGTMWAALDLGTIQRCDAPCDGRGFLDVRAFDPRDRRSATWVNAVSGSGPDDVWFTTLDGDLLRWDGALLTSATSGPRALLRGVWAGGPDEVWAVGSGGVVLRRRGGAWLPVYSTTTADLSAVWGGGEAVWIAGEYGVLARWDPAAGAFSRVRGDGGGNPTGAHLSGISGLPGGEVFVSGWGCRGALSCPPEAVQGQVLRCRPAGCAAPEWTNTPGLQAIWAYSGSEVWAVGDRGTALRYDGTRWAGVSLPPGYAQADLYALFGTGPGEVWIGGDTGAGPVLLHIRDGRTEVVPIGFGVFALWGTQGDDLWGVGRGGTTDSLWHFDGSTWRPVPGTQLSLFGISGHGADQVWAVGLGGAILGLRR